MPLITIKECENCGIDHEWMFDGAKLRELRVIKQLTGMSQRQFAEAGDEGDPEALAALIYILHMRDKIKVPFDDIDLDFNNFTMELTDQERKEMEAAEAAERAKDDPKDGVTRNGPKKKAGSKAKS